MPRGRFETVPHTPRAESLIEDTIKGDVYIWTRGGLLCVTSPITPIKIKPRQLPIGVTYSGELKVFDLDTKRVVKSAEVGATDTGFKLPFNGRAYGDFYATWWDGTTELFLRESKIARLSGAEYGKFLTLEFTPHFRTQAFFLKPSPTGGVLTRFDLRDQTSSRVDLRPADSLRIDGLYVHRDFDVLKYPWLVGFVESDSKTIPFCGAPVLDLRDSRARRDQRNFALCYINLETGDCGAFAFVIMDDDNISGEREVIPFFLTQAVAARDRLWVLILGQLYSFVFDPAWLRSASATGKDSQTKIDLSPAHPI